MRYLHDNLRLCATIVSDTHIDIKHPVKIVPMYLLMSALRGAKKSRSDAFITVGDTTSAGTAVNWALARKCFKMVPDAAEKIILSTFSKWLRPCFFIIFYYFHYIALCFSCQSVKNRIFLCSYCSFFGYYFGYKTGK